MHMIRLLAIVALSALACTVAGADDLWTRTTLLDTPDGLKQDLKAKGVDLAVDVTNYFQGLEDDGEEFANGGKADLRIRLDGQKLGLWRGFFVTSHVEYNYGNDVNQAARGLNIIPINTAMAYPSAKSNMFSLLLTQAFSPTTTLTVGLFNMFDVAARRPLVGGDTIDTFWNLAIRAPLTNITPPYIYGVSFNTRNDVGSFGLFIYDPRDAQDLDIISDLFSDGVTYSGTATFPVTIGGRSGFQNLRVAYSTLDGIDLSSLPPGIGQPPKYKTDRWYLQYSFEQFLGGDPKDPKVGWGLFGQFGYSDGNPNAFQGHGFIGLAGNNLTEGRVRDRWGVGYYSYKLSDAFRDALPLVGSSIKPNKGMEAFYNWAVTPWFRLTFNAQWSRPYNGIDDNYYLGTSAQIKFF